MPCEEREVMSKLKYGDRIGSKTRPKKVGRYIGKIRHTIKHKGEELAMVKFDNNKGMSRVPISELIKEDEEKADSA
jgi:hypothetical protein